MYIKGQAPVMVADRDLLKSTVVAGTRCVHLGPAEPRHLTGPYVLCPEGGGIPQGDGLRLVHPIHGVLVSSVYRGGLSCPDPCAKCLIPLAPELQPISCSL